MITNYPVFSNGKSPTSEFRMFNSALVVKSAAVHRCSAVGTSWPEGLCDPGCDSGWYLYMALSSSLPSIYSSQIFEEFVRYAPQWDFSTFHPLLCSSLFTFGHFTVPICSKLTEHCRHLLVKSCIYQVKYQADSSHAASGSGSCFWDDRLLGLAAQPYKITCSSFVIFRR
jgi:hypothetical protein